MWKVFRPHVSEAVGGLWPANSNGNTAFIGLQIVCVCEREISRNTHAREGGAEADLSGWLAE